MKNELLNNIKSYEKMEDIAISDNILSAFDLYQIVSKKFAELANITFDTDLERRINKYIFNEDLNGKKLKIFKKPKRKVDGILTTVNNGIIKFSICTADTQKNGTDTYWTTIHKKIGDDKISIKSNASKNENLIQEFMSDIERHINIMEEFYKLFTSINKNIKFLSRHRSFEQVFDGSYLDFKIICNDLGIVTYELVPEDKNVDPNVLEYIRSNSSIIMKKIPISVDELNPALKIVVKDHLEKEKNKIQKKIVA